LIRRLLLSYLTITVIVLVVLEVPLGLVFQQRQTDRLTVNVERDATVLASRYEDAVELEAPLRAGQAAAYARATGVRVVIVDQRGVSLIDTAGRRGATSRAGPSLRSRYAASAPREPVTRARSTPTCCM
jgi:hypothetical protein